VSYSLRVVPDAQSALVSLDPTLQEETLDEIELRLLHPDRLVPRAGESLIIFDFTRIISDRTHYVFLTLRADHGARMQKELDLGPHAS
jgi:hypothetical protein